MSGIGEGEDDLAGGATQEVIFNAARDTAGTFTVDVNGITGSFVVRAPETEISVFSITPNYGAETNDLTFTTINYQLDNLYEPMADVELVLNVSLDNEPLEEVSLLSTSQLKLGNTDGKRDYIPAGGWKSGTYTFQAKLYVGNELYTSTAEEKLEVAPESVAAMISWGILGMIIGSMLVIIAVTVFVILRRSRRLLGV